jgi:NAD(P)-dependent dehydrogenase (short-subunit alcohol dehydrogenase family)
MTTPLVALVTGANKGIGRAVAAQLAAEGVRVYLGSRDVARGRSAADEITAVGGDARVVQLDVTNDASVAAAIAHIEADSGALDILVNNAGIALDPPVGGPTTTAAATMMSTFDTNVLGVLRVTNAAAPLLRRSGRGRIVNVSSEVGSKSIWSDPTTPMAMFAPQVPAYAASKAALNMLTVAYAKELAADGVKVNSVSPGHIGTDLNRNMGPGTPAQGAAVIVPYALLGDDGPTGAFFGEHGPVAW